MNLTQHIKNISSGVTGVAQSKQLVGTNSISNTVNTQVQNQVTYAGDGLTDRVVTTGIESYDANYDVTLEYTAGSGGHTEYAFDRTNMKLFQYINATPSIGAALVEGSWWTEVLDDVAIDFLSSKIEIKRLDVSASSHFIADTIRGLDKYIYSDLTNIEATVVDAVLSVTSTGVTLGVNAGVNGSGPNYVLSQYQYNKLVITTNNHGKRVLVAYDAVSNRGMALHVGSGLDGYELPTFIGDEVQLGHTKSLGVTLYNWQSGGKVIGDNASLILNETDVINYSSVIYGASDNILLKFGTNVGVNKVDVQHITYFEGNSDVTKIFSYSGDGTVGQKLLTDGREPSRVVVKSTSNAYNWYLFDNTRGNDGHPLVLNSNITEATITDYIDFKLDGVEIKVVSTDISGDGVQFIGIAYFNSKNTVGGGSYSDLPSDTSNLQIVDGQLIFGNGYFDNHALNTGESFVGTNTITPTNGWNQGINFIKRVADTEWLSTLDKPIFGTTPNRTIAGYNPDIFQDGKWWNSTNGDEKVVNGEGTDLTGWTINNVVATVDNGRFKLDDSLNAGADSSLSRSIGVCELGVVYQLRFTIEGDDGRIRIETGFALADILDTGAVSIDGSHKYEFMGTGVELFIYLGVDGTGINYYSDVSSFNQNIEKDTAYTTPITYLDGGVEVDVSGNVVVWEAGGVVPDLNIESIHIDGDFSFGDRPILNCRLGTSPVLTGFQIIPMVSQLFNDSIDTHNGLQSGVYIVPKKGFYEVDFRTTMNNQTAGIARLSVYKNLEIASSLRSALGIGYLPVSGSVIVHCEKGDTLAIASYSASTSNASTTTSNYNDCQIEYIGEQNVSN